MIEKVNPMHPDKQADRIAGAIVDMANSIFHYWAKHYEESSEDYGINGGRISKLMLKRNGKIVYNYDRGLDIEPADKQTETALAILMKEYN